jgi:hypothetical protein
MSNVERRHIGRMTCFAFAALVAVPCLVMPCLVGMPRVALADETFSVKHTVAIPGNPLTSFDISWVDPYIHSYFLADRSNKAIDVIDTRTLTVRQIMPGFAGFTGNNNTSGPDGVLTIFNNGKVEIWAGDGNSRVWVLDYETGSVIKTISTGTTINRADELCYDRADHLIAVANDADTPPFISFIATEGTNAYQVVAKIPVPDATNGLEQCQWSERTGLIYANVPEINGPGNDTADGNVLVIDPKVMPPKVLRAFDIPVSKCAGPQGMALGPFGQILLGCNAIYPFDASCNAVVPCPPGTVQNAAVIDEDNGRIIRVLENEGGADEVWFNPHDGHYFLADGSHLPNEQLGIVDSFPLIRPDPSFVVGNAGATTRRAHSVAADSESDAVFLPVPATGGGTPPFTSTVCGALAATGCIAVLKSDERHDF